MKTWEEVKQAIYELAVNVPDSRLERIDILVGQLDYELDEG